MNLEEEPASVEHGEGACVEQEIDILCKGYLFRQIRMRQEKEKEMKRFENDLLEKIRKDNAFENIKNAITPRALENCYSNSLLMSMKVSFKLRKLADSKGPDEERVNQLANSVEEFTYCLLDPLRSDQYNCEQFGEHILDHIVDEAIDLDQKKFFTHPVVHDEMSRKWHGRDKFMKRTWRSRDFKKNEWRSWLQLILFRVWCIFDLVFSPILFSVFSLLKKRSERCEGSKEANEKERQTIQEGSQISQEKSHVTVADMYLIYLKTPFFKYVRDTLSYIVLVVLHYALCLSPSTIAFSRLEWAILVFFIGRYLVEHKQICDILKRIKRRKENGDVGAQSKWIRLKTLSIYLSDCWNKLDFISLLVYLIICTLRLATVVMSGSEMNNRALAIAGYFYSFNTLCLTLRAFGYVSEHSRHVGPIQIALFSILTDIRIVFWQFTAGILAFSIAITKVYMTEKSFIANGSDGNDIACRNSGPSCWWTMVTHLGWALLGVHVSEESDPMNSVDVPSVTLARLLYATFLIFGAILLINMLIALLSETYQRTRDNSLKEWSIKRAAVIQTYDGYDPIPVPLNIIYRIGKLLRSAILIIMAYRKKEEEKTACGNSINDIEAHGRCKIANYLEAKYFAKHANSFPITGEDKVDRVLHETEKNRQMGNQILTTTFKSQNSDQGLLYRGPKAWADVDQCIRIEGLLLTCEGSESCKPDDPYTLNCHGSRHCKSFSSEFPHFGIAILETGEKRLLGVGVVNEEYSTKDMPGWYNGSVGYHTDNGKIFHDNPLFGKETKGPAMARRGDRIRCTVMFENKRKIDGKVPVVFTLNGKKIILKEGEDQIFMDADKPLYPYIAMTDGCSVLVKMCPKEDLDSKVTQCTDERMTAIKEQFASSIAKFAERGKEVEEIWKSLEGTNQKLDTVLAIKAQSESSIARVAKLEKGVEEMGKSLEGTNQKLDTLLAMFKKDQPKV